MLALLLTLALSATPPSEQPRPDDATAPTPAEGGPGTVPRKLKVRLVPDLVATGVLGAGWLVSEFAIKKMIAPSACRWCGPNPFDQGFRGVFNPAFSHTADTLSNVFAFGLVPLASLGMPALFAWQHDALDTFWVDALLILQATFSAMAVNQVVKFLVARQRPFVGTLTQEELDALRDPADNDLSFFSGHTTFTFALVTAAATVAQMRGYKYWWAILAIGGPLALGTGVLRMAADKHYASDVWVGTAMGSLFGAGIPLLFHGLAKSELPVTVAPSGNGVALSGTF